MESEGSLPRSHELPSFLSWAIRIQSTSSHLISSRPILILSLHAYVVLVSFLWVSPAKPCMLSSPCVPHASPISHFAVKSALQYLVITSVPVLLSLIFSGYWRPFPTGRQANHPVLSSAEAVNAWSCTSTPPYAFVAWCFKTGQLCHNLA